MFVSALIFSLTAAVTLSAPLAQAEPTDPPPTTGPSADADNHSASVYGEKFKDTSGTQDYQQPPSGQKAPSDPPRGGKAPGVTKVSNPPKDVEVEVRTEACTDMTLDQCRQGRTACLTSAGGPAGFRPPTLTWLKIGDGSWTYNGLTCGPPTSIELPGSGGTVSVAVQAPPVPTLGQIQTAFKELPFSKPSVTVQPVGMKTLKNLKTFYAAHWPNNTGLQPGETSKPVKLLSWTVEFKVDAQDYRYDFGDGTHSNWTTSSGGTYPDGDITHTYTDTGTVDIKVDARLTGQYRVNGGDWQDIATTADLQDEPTGTLTIVGTKTRLTTDEG
ncbi:hypothetical protein [Janibacter limosus]|uniref:hypothetical protein n=1 Tax=Janibacter limosus TaxID=53458 RepID=UPI001FE22DB6|nr:hypothetical protein [Janibacter limosus]